ncbi:phage integrase N-terminal SAM-like domain-containing protein [Agaribacter flavus]|uniref:Phage integrase N-terminal SAM-like domain-containing protein n=1 Tax=Agaribacter flavus TaxID=1902781 RepID=A0ABV7FUD3_9ALTE
MSSTFLTQISDFMYRKRYAKSTIESYLFVIKGFIRFHNYKHPIMLTPSEVADFFALASGAHKLPIALLYGSGLRLMECLRLRCQDIDFDYKAVRVWNSKGGRHRIITLAD